MQLSRRDLLASLRVCAVVGLQDAQVPGLTARQVVLWGPGL